MSLNGWHQFSTGRSGSPNSRERTLAMLYVAPCFAKGVNQRDAYVPGDQIHARSMQSDDGPTAFWKLVSVQIGNVYKARRMGPGQLRARSVRFVRTCRLVVARGFVAFIRGVFMSEQLLV
ncbi:hypothetical protein D3C72_2115620 [compost metagenome]